MKKELNSRQWALYNYLKEKGDEWTLQEYVAFDLEEFYDGNKSRYNFHDCPARMQLTDDIRAINTSDVIQKIIISSSKGIKLASKDDFTRYLKQIGYFIER